MTEFAKGGTVAARPGHGDEVPVTLSQDCCHLTPRVLEGLGIAPEVLAGLNAEVES